MARTQILLNGQWQIAPGQGDTPPTRWLHELPVPGLVDLATPRYNWSVHEYHWYRKRFTIPEGYVLTFLKIHQAMFGTAVWMNGKFVGSDIACYTSQEYDIGSTVNHGTENELLVRVGAKSALSPESAVGKDQERTEFIPGIWGDVELLLCGSPRIKLVQVIPHVGTGIAESRFWVENRSAKDVMAELSVRVLEKKSRKVVSPELKSPLLLKPNGETVVTLDLPIKTPTLWFPENPFLYEVESSITTQGVLTDKLNTVVGMREFKIVGSDFYLNGKRIFLRGGNIAFHRFLSDADRGSLPWDLNWIKKALIDIPKAHNFNFFRNHLGQMYNRWYDIADEYGMVLQNEWQFWTTTGTKEEITKEFTRWLQDNWNHPSIIIWDALNECTDAVVQNEIVPQMKRLDPTRPWESVDFIEQHPYIYSLGPVLNERKFGYSEPLEEIGRFTMPSVLNEFLWWWLDKDWKPTILTQDVIERWLGRDYKTDELIEHQSFLAGELVELFRRMRVDAIQPFVYISNNAGPTANWFIGDIRELKPKPVLKALKNAFAPFGLSLELWDRHFFAGESRTLRLFVFNDESEPRSGVVRYGIVKMNGDWVNDTSLRVSVDASGCSVIPVKVTMPRQTGEYRIRAELTMERGSEVVAYSQKIAHVFDLYIAVQKTRGVRVALARQDKEIAEFLRQQDCSVESIAGINKVHTIIIGEGMLKDPSYQRHLDEVSRHVKNGGTIIVIEPEYGVNGKEEIQLLDTLSLTVERREDADRGGYDSYVFPEAYQHPLWREIEKKHLQIFNGAFGGEVVSQHNIMIAAPHKVLARCGLRLNVIAAAEIAVGSGRIIISRIQTRGRLAGRNQSESLYDRRVDPVAQRYFLNLVLYAGNLTKVSTKTPLTSSAGEGNIT